jgi:hypothetical protein
VVEGLDEVDGVPVLWADLEGPFHAHLLFGVGQAHETLPLHGITHLVEHLVLSGSNEGPHAYNGTTGLVTTSFVAAGEVSHVVAHLADVCRGLRQLPLHRLEHERQVLRAEAAQRPTGPGDVLAMWRWGPVGYGLSAYEEMALKWVGAPQLAPWATRFNRHNAVVWMSKPPPAGLRLELPEQDARPQAPGLVSQAAPLPASFPIEGRGVSFSFLGRREPEAMPAFWLLHHRLEQRLRHQLGIVYGVTGGNDVLDADTRHWMFRLDCLEENSRRVQDEALVVLRGLGEPPTHEEWERWVAARSLGMEQPTDVRRAQFLDVSALEVLMGRGPLSMDEYEQRAAAVTPEQVNAYLIEARRSLVIGVVAPAELPDDLARPLPLYSGSRVNGTVLSPSTRHPNPHVHSAVVGQEGATLVFQTGDVVSVRAANLAGALCFDDGTRHLMSTDGFHVKIAPEEWQDAGPALQALDAGIDPYVRIPAGTREPSPERPGAVARPVVGKHGWTRREVTVLAWMAVLAVFGLVELALGNTDAGSFYPSAAVVVSAWMAVRRYRRRSDGGS